MALPHALSATIHLRKHFAGRLQRLLAVRELAQRMTQFILGSVVTMGEVHEMVAVGVRNFAGAI